jgi:hypothetical protein
MFIYKFCGFSLSVLFHHGSPYSYSIWWVNNRLVGGDISETQSHPIGMNNGIMLNIIVA